MPTRTGKQHVSIAQPADMDRQKVLPLKQVVSYAALVNLARRPASRHQRHAKTVAPQSTPPAQARHRVSLGLRAAWDRIC